MEELGMDPDEITDEDCSSLRWTGYLLILQWYCHDEPDIFWYFKKLMKSCPTLKTPGMSARQFLDVQAWWQVLELQLCSKRWTTRWGLSCAARKIVELWTCFSSGRCDRHRRLSFPIPPPLQECDAVQNLSDDGDQLQVWPPPFRGDLSIIIFRVIVFPHMIATTARAKS